MRFSPIRFSADGLLAIAGLLGLLACGGGANPSPTSPTPSPPPGTGTPSPAPPGSGSACRTYSSDETAVITGTLGGRTVSSGTRITRCGFNRAALEFRCTSDHTDTQNSFTATTIGRFASVGDFVGDAPRIFIQATRETRGLDGTSTHTVGGTTTAATVTNTYDSDRRLTRQAIRITGGGEMVLTYTAWDQFGRPTAWRDETYSYTAAFNDADRTIIVTNSLGGTVTNRYDANGIRIFVAGSTPGGADSTEVITVRATETVCR